VRPLQRRLGRALAIAGLAFIAAATLAPLRDPRGLSIATPLLCLVCGERGGADVAANLLLFLPLALGLRLSGESWSRTVLLAGLISFTVELLQLRVVPGRDASLSDLLTNTSSGAIGATIGGLLPRVIAPTPTRAWAFLAGSTAALLLLLATSAWLLTPWTPDGELMSRWAHESLGSDVFGGRVWSVRLDGMPMPPNGPPPDSAAFRRRLDGGRLALEIDLVSGAPVRDRSWIYMFRVPSGGALTLSQLGREAAVAVPARALRFRLQPPMLTLPDGLPGATGVPVRLSAVEEGRRLRLSSAYAGSIRTVELTLSPPYGWVMIMPFALAGSTAVRWITAACLWALVLPLGYWAGWTRRPAGAVLALAAALVSLLAVLPAAAGFPTTHWSEWLAGALGAASGWALHGPAAYLQRRCASPSDSGSSSS